MKPLWIQTRNRALALTVLMVLMTGSLFGQKETQTKSGKAASAEPTAAPKSAVPATLDEMLAKALKDNPDLRVAEAKLREADAELNRTRLQVMQKVVLYYRNVEANKALVEHAEKDFEMYQKIYKNGTLSATEFNKAQGALQQAKMKLAEVEAELPYLLGQSQLRRDGVPVLSDIPQVGQLFSDGSVRMPHFLADKSVPNERYFELSKERSQPLQAATAERIRKALDSTITVDFADTPLGDALEYFQHSLPNASLVRLNPAELEKHKINLKLNGQVPLGAALQAIEDATGLRFAVREYGIVVTAADKLPTGAMSLHSFWKNPPAEEKKLETQPKR